MQSEENTLFNSTQLDRAIEILRAVTHKDRIRILELVQAKGSISVNELSELMQTDQSLMSQNLKILRDAGLVTTQRNGKYIYYKIADKNLQNVAQAVLRFHNA